MFFLLLILRVITKCILSLYSTAEAAQEALTDMPPRSEEVSRRVYQTDPLHPYTDP